MLKSSIETEGNKTTNKSNNFKKYSDYFKKQKELIEKSER